MAFKPNSIDRVAAMQYSSDTVDIIPVRLRITDASYTDIDIDNHTVDITISALEVKDIDWSYVFNHLQEAGVSNADCNYLVEQFADMAFQHLTAKALAKKIRRI